MSTITTDKEARIALTNFRDWLSKELPAVAHAPRMVEMFTYIDAKLAQGDKS